MRARFLPLGCVLFAVSACCMQAGAPPGLSHEPRDPVPRRLRATHAHERAPKGAAREGHAVSVVGVPGGRAIVITSAQGPSVVEVPSTP